MDHQRIFFSSYLALLYGASTSLIADILVQRDAGNLTHIDFLHSRIQWNTIFASLVFYGCSGRLQWWFGQDEYRSTFVKWKMRGEVWFLMGVVLPLLTASLSDCMLAFLGEKIDHMMERYIYTPPIAMILTAACELSGVNHSIRVVYLQQ
jgi:hypothetical protein